MPCRIDDDDEEEEETLTVEGKLAASQTTRGYLKWNIHDDKITHKKHVNSLDIVTLLRSFNIDSQTYRVVYFFTNTIVTILVHKLLNKYYYLC